MMPDLEAVGDVATGAVLAGAVERSGAAADGHTHERNCLNCGTELAGEFCHVCGQRAHVHRSIGAFFHDLLHGVLHFEGKIWNTLPMLAWKPGELTRDYIEGKRARYVSPIALFLFSVFLMFAVIGLTSNAIRPQASAEAARELRKEQIKLDALETQRAAAVKAGTPTKRLDEKIAESKVEMTALQAVRTGTIDPATYKFQSDFLGGLDEGLGKAAKNPELLFYKIKTNAYKFSWALIPISVPLVWLLFPFSRRFGLYDHTVFVTYSLCFMMLLLTASTLVGLVADSVASLAFFVPPFHMYRQLKGAYGLKGRAALWRTALLTIFAFVAISLFGSLLVALGLFD
jgi:Protein of unknown function (DUF3667)